MITKWELKDHQAERGLFNRRLAITGLLVMLLFAALIAKLINLQVYRHEYFSARSDGNRLHSQYVPPARGLIFDRNGNLLADNQPIFNLTIVPEQVDDLEATLAFIGTRLQLTDDEIGQFRNRMQRSRVPFSSVLLRYALSEEEKSRIAVSSHWFPGIVIEPQVVRHYPLAELAAHAVGYVSEINRDELDRLTAAEQENYGGTNHIGKTGIERTYEALLHGSVGYETVEKNNRGQIMRRLERTDPVAGKNISLHLDAQLQIAAQRALGELRGAVVAIEPATGGIMALVSNPGFDPNLFVVGISSTDYSQLINDAINTPLYDRTISPYAPGSTIKPFLGLAGLHHEYIDYDYTIDDPGYFRLPNVSYRFGDWTLRTANGGGHGHTNLQRAIYQSCNTFFYGLGHRMGIDIMHDFMARFGFGDNFALDLAHARTGVLPSTAWKMAALGEPWYPGETLHAAIGQGYMLVTPLQLATATAILANRGKVLPPRLLKAVEGVMSEPTGGARTPVDVVLDDADYWRYIQQAMTMVVHRPYSDAFRDYGTAYESIAMTDPAMPYRMAGKSGTAQVVSIDQSVLNSDDIEVSELNRDQGLFIAFAPVLHPHIEPQIALAVFVENGESGSNVAGPIAKQIIDAYLLDILQLDFAALEEAMAEDPMLISQADE